MSGTPGGESHCTHAEATPGTEPAARLSTQRRARRQAAEKLQGPRGLSEAGIGTDSATDDSQARTRQIAEELTAEDDAPDEDQDMDTGFVGIMEESVGDFVGGLLLQQLGGAGRRYKREHRKACSRIVSGMYSPP